MSTPPLDVVIASSNPGKLREFRAILPARYRVRSQSEFGVPAVEETGSTFVDNALLKARHASKFTGMPSIADDSGLEVDALDGEPGVRSARYAGDGASDRDNLDKLIKAMRGVPPERRTARFRCAIVFVRSADDTRPLICEATWQGSIQTAPSGDNGFGYDPVFHVPGHRCSAAELDPRAKNRLSHRAQALAKLVQQLE